MPFKDPKKKRDYHRAYMKEWKIANPDYFLIYVREQKKEMPWIKHYHNIKSRLSNYNTKKKRCYRKIKCLLTIDLIKKLWIRDRAYEMDKPHIHRKDSSGDYCFKNCIFVEAKQHYKIHSELRKIKLLSSVR